MSKGLFITGTGTDAGKTFVTALLVKKLREAGYSAGYYKAALSGAAKEGNRLIPGDAEYVRKTAKLDAEAEEMVSYIYEKAVSPHLAGELENRPAGMEKILEDYRRICSRWEYVTAEGSGGIICPIVRNKILLEDIIREMGLGILIVAPAGLGTINSTMLTAAYARQKNIPVKGVILNRFHRGDEIEEDNKRFLEETAGIPVIACVEEGAKEIAIEADSLAQLYEKGRQK